jgi:uncharacterized membrane protein
LLPNTNAIPLSSPTSCPPRVFSICRVVQSVPKRFAKRSRRNVSIMWRRCLARRGKDCRDSDLTRLFGRYNRARTEASSGANPMPTEVVRSRQRRLSEREALMFAWQAVDPNLPQRPLLWGDLRLLWATLALVVIILVGAIVIVWADRWRKRSQSQPLSANDQLAHFRELYEDGELSLKEFERIRATLARQLRAEFDVAAEPPPAAPPQEPPPQANPQAPPTDLSGGQPS